MNCLLDCLIQPSGASEQDRALTSLLGWVGRASKKVLTMAGLAECAKNIRISKQSTRRITFKVVNDRTISQHRM